MNQWELDPYLISEPAGKKELVGKVIVSKLAEIESAQQSGLPTSIIIPGRDSDITPLSNSYSNYYDFYTQRFWEKLPKPKSTHLRDSLTENRRIEDYISQQIAAALGIATTPIERVSTSNRYGPGTHYFYLTTQPLTVFHIFGWELESVGGGIDLVTVNIPFEQLISWSRELRSTAQA